MKKNIRVNNNNNSNNNEVDNYFITIAKLVLPEEFLISFDLSSVDSTSNEIRIILTEKEDIIPKELSNIVWWDYSKVVLDWYCRPIELMDFPIRDRSTFITLKKRRWKLSKDEWEFNLYKDKSFTNEYSLHFPWMKTTKKFGLFLKELTREELNELLDSFPVYKDLFKEDI